MIALGGAIGAGLFIGSGTLIKTTGPAAFVTSALTGAIIVLVMRMLAEMAVARPSTGSFADFAPRRARRLGRVLRRLALLVLLGDRGRVRGRRRAPKCSSIGSTRRSGCSRSS